MQPLTIPTGFWDRDDVTTAIRERDFAALFTLLRRWAGASQTKISAACDLTQAVVSRIMTGRQEVRDIAVYERIADGLHMPDPERTALGLAPRLSGTPPTSHDELPKQSPAVRALSRPQLPKDFPATGPSPDAVPASAQPARSGSPRTLLAQLIRDRNLSYEETAAHLGLSARHLARLARAESGHASREVHPSTRRILTAFFDAPVEQLLAPPPHTLSVTPRPVWVADVDVDTPELEDVLAVLQRVHRYRHVVDPEIVAQLSANVTHLVERYEEHDHGALASTLVRQHAWIGALLDECPSPRQRAELMAVAAGTAGLLGYVAVGRGAFPVARAYLAEAFCLAELGEHPNLRAWVRGTQSLVEYYAGNYRDALDLAEDGLNSAASTSQVARLAANGVARAAGKLGAPTLVGRAVDTALNAVDADGSPPGFPSSVTFGSYSPAQVATNAATAYLSLGQSDDVQRYLHSALPEVQQSGSPWTHSLVLIDLATAVATAPDADADRAAALLVEALNHSAGRPIIAVQTRAAEFLHTATDRWGHIRQLELVRDALPTVGYSHD